jgi:hypothetical protein
MSSSPVSFQDALTESVKFGRGLRLRGWQGYYVAKFQGDDLVLLDSENRKGIPNITEVSLALIYQGEWYLESPELHDARVQAMGAIRRLREIQRACELQMADTEVAH